MAAASKPGPHEPDMTVGAQQVERRLAMLARASSRSFAGIARNGMHADQVAELVDCAGASPNTSRLKRVSSSARNRSSIGPSGRSLIRIQGKRSPARRRVLRQAGQRLRQRALRIADADLRDGAEREAPDPLEPHRDRGDTGNDCRAQQPAAASRPRRSAWNARSVVSQQPLRDRHALLLVGVEQGRHRRGPARRARASTRGCRRPAGRCSCPARPPGCGCGRRRRAGSSGGRGSVRRRGDGCGRSRTSCTA